MNLVTSNLLKKRFSSVLFTLFNRLENNNNADFHTNGEERFLNEYFSSLKGNVTLFDVGANVGGYSEILVALCDKHRLDYSLHLFEPTKKCFAELQKKFSANNSVKLNNVGVSDTKTETEIFYDAEGSGFASLYRRNIASINLDLNKKETISLVRLDEYFATQNITHIDFLKIDIEGHELSAFAGMGKYLNSAFVKAIQFEYGGANLDSKTTLFQIYRTLESAGFVLAKVMKNGIEIRSYQPWMENFQYANYVALSTIFFPVPR